MEKDIWKHIDGVISSLSQINSEYKSMDPFFRNMDALTKEIQIYLKVQWERVKVEINGGTWDEATEERYSEKIEGLYRGEVD